MPSALDKLEVGIPCPGCGHETQKSLGWLKTNDELVCGGCGETIDIHDDGFREKLAEAERKLADIFKDLK